MVAVKGARAAEIGAADPIITRLAAEDKVAWYRKPNLRYLYFMLLPTCMGIEITSGFDSQLINALQIVPAWNLYFENPQGPIKGIISAAYPLGAILSLPFVPYVNEWWGRRWAIFLGSVVMCIGAIVQGFSVNVAMYCFARGILGFGIPTCIVAGAALIGELGHPKERPILTSLFNVAYFVGQLTAAGICVGTNKIVGNMSWRIPSYLQIVPSLMQMAFVFFLPDSPRWLVSRDRSEEAFAILVKYHGEDDADSEFVKAEFAQVQATIQLEKSSGTTTWVNLIQTAGMRRRMFISAFLGLFTQWSGNTLISYYLSDILTMIGKTDPDFKMALNTGLSAWNLVVGGTAAMLVNRYRRRVMYLVCTCSLLTVYVCWTASMAMAMKAKDEKVPNEAAAIATIFFIFMYAPAYNIGYNALTYTYMVEMWPYVERSSGIAWFQLFGRMANFFTTFVNPIGLKDAGWKYLLSYCIFLVFEITFVYFFFPETFGRTLEELAFLFEGREKADEAVRAVEKVVNINHEEHEIRNKEAA